MKLLPIFDDRFKDDGKSKANLRIMREEVAAFFRKVLGYGDEAFELCFKKGEKLGRWADCTLMSLARHVLVYFDGLSVHFSSGTVECCPPLMRSMLEATLGIAHIAESLHEERSLAYNLSRIKRRIKNYRMGDVEAASGKKLQEDLANDAAVPDFLSKPPPGLGKRADDLESQLNSDPIFTPILKEWNKLKNPEWFTLFGGAKPAKTVRDLAKNLNWLSLYICVYRPFSDSIHAGNALDSYITKDKALRPLRYPKHYGDYLNVALMVFIYAIERMARFYDQSMGEQVGKHMQLSLMPEVAALSKKLEYAIGEYK